MTSTKMKFVFMSLVGLGLTTPSLAAIPHIQIQCNTQSKTQNELQVQLETGYVYESLQIKTQNNSKTVTLKQADLQLPTLQMTFNSPVKSVTLTYQDPDTANVVVLAEDVLCSKPAEAQTATPIAPSALTASEILPPEEPETSAQILGIETSSKRNPKYQTGAHVNKKKTQPKVEEKFDFSEDIEDF